MARKNFNELRSKMSPAASARAAAKTAAMLKDLALSELRMAKEITQTELASRMDVDQAAVSKLERRTDMHVSTLAGVIQALGGRLELRAEFPDGDSYSVHLSSKHRKPAV
jgi:DNA-binding Xre family transcriptional regulator